MKTLNKSITAGFYAHAGGYGALGAHWGRLMRDKEARKRLSCAHHLLYLILRGKNWQKGFAPITNSRKLENGGSFNWGLRQALYALHRGEPDVVAPFADYLHPDAIDAIQLLMPKPGWGENPLEREPYAGKE